MSSESYPEYENKKKAAVLGELTKTPIVAVAVKRAGISRATYYRWREDDEIFEADADLALAKGQDLINDLAESKLIERVKEGELGALKYWLGWHHYQYMGKAKSRIPYKRPPRFGVLGLWEKFWKD